MTTMEIINYVLIVICLIQFAFIAQNVLKSNTVTIRVIVDTERASLAAALLRERGFGVTEFIGKGREEERVLLLVLASRERYREARSVIEEYCHGAVISVDNTSEARGAYIKKT